MAGKRLLLDERAERKRNLVKDFLIVENFVKPKQNFARTIKRQTKFNS
jgi:hypothetical protein